MSDKRFDGDSWDIETSVGYTALLVAAARAREAGRDDALASDPYARLFVEAAGEPRTLALSRGDGVAHPFAQSRFIGLRTRFFDDFVTTAIAAGIRQVVILAAGLDARAQRLTFPTGTVVYELDQPRVLEFKAQVLADHVVRPAADLRHVTVDLRDDWPAALHAAGFAPGRPSAWLVEGLLPYLPAQAQDLLFARIATESGAGSRIAVEAFTGVFDIAAVRERMRRAAAERGDQEAPRVDISGLIYADGGRSDPAHTLAETGWRVTRSVDPRELAQEYGVDAPQSVDRPPTDAPAIRYVTAERPVTD